MSEMLNALTLAGYADVLGTFTSQVECVVVAVHPEWRGHGGCRTMSLVRFCCLFSTVMLHGQVRSEQPL